jgi:RND family efflux transporter MFP subunit
VKLSRLILLVLFAAATAALGWGIYLRLVALQQATHGSREAERPVPVVVAPIERAPIVSQRTFSGTLEAYAEFVAAPKVGGIIERLSVNIGDSVARGHVVAELDNAEFVQAVAQAKAELQVAEANLEEASSLLTIAERELKRIDQLSGRGVSSASQRDIAQADHLAKQAHVEVTLAQVARAQAQVETAQIRLGYTQVRADWHGDNETRLVAERYVDEGENVSANTPLLKIIKLNPIVAVIFVTEKEYAGLQTGQPVSLATDAYPGSEFNGKVSRIAPVFREATRQARVEVQVDNSAQRLKPGMFVRVNVVFERLNEATVIPAQALTSRDNEEGVFVLADDGQRVTWRSVRRGIRQGERLQVTGEGLQGAVVVLGQQLLNDGSSILLTDPRKSP